MQCFPIQILPIKELHGSVSDLGICAVFSVLPAVLSVCAAVLAISGAHAGAARIIEHIAYVADVDIGKVVFITS